MIDYQTLKNWRFADIEHRYSVDDAMLYALGVGFGADPLDEQELKFVDETLPGTPLAVPTLAVTLGYPGSWLRDPATGVDQTMVVHGEETITLHRPLASAGVVTARHQVTRVIDKGVGRGAIVTYDKQLFTADDPAPLATVTHSTFCRGNGGFSARDGVTDEAPPAAAPVPGGTPDQVVELATLPQQALLYRLCADRNPLHSVPAIARKAGFHAPILHGLGTYGFACRAVLRAYCDYDPARLASLSARFSSPVFPGETLRFEFYRDGAQLSFRAKVAARDKVVLDYGRASLR